MSTQSKSKRIERLEAKTGPAETIGAIFVRGMRPTPSGPEPDSGFAYILEGDLAGSQLVQEPGETWQAFEARVEASL